MLQTLRLIDCGNYTAIAAQRWLNIPENITPTVPDVYVYVTDTTPMFQQLATQFLGMPLQEPVRVSIDHHAPSSKEFL